MFGEEFLILICILLHIWDKALLKRFECVIIKNTFEREVQEMGKIHVSSFIGFQTF